MKDVTAALAVPEQPGATFDALARSVDRTVSAQRFALLETDRRRGVAKCRSSNMREAYPVTGERGIEPYAWTAIADDRHPTFVANAFSEIAAVCRDYALIQVLGCERCINVPVIAGGRVIVTRNCLHGAGHSAPVRGAVSEALKLPGAAAFGMAANLNTGG